jgi:hypothetical protein
LGEELADRGCALLNVGLQGEVTGVGETNVGVGDVALEGLGPGQSVSQPGTPTWRSW